MKTSFSLAGPTGLEPVPSDVTGRAGDCVAAVVRHISSLSSTRPQAIVRKGTNNGPTKKGKGQSPVMNWPGEKLAFLACNYNAPCRRPCQALRGEK